MATKLFPTSVGTVTDYTTDTDRELHLSSSGVATLTTNTAAGPSTIQFAASGTPVSWWFKVMGVAITGTVTFNIWASESSMSANIGVRVVVDRHNSAGTYVSNIVTSNHGTELTTSMAARNWTATPTSTTLADGDLIRVRIYFTDTGGTQASGYSGSLDYGGGTGAGTDGDTYVQFNETITAWHLSYPDMPPVDNRLSWWKADSLGLSDGASVPTWNDEDGKGNLTKNSAATVTYSAAGGPNSKPMVVFNETGGFDGTYSADPGSVLGAIYVIYNNYTTGPQLFGTGSPFWVQEPGAGGWLYGGVTGSIGGGSTSPIGWHIMVFLWNGAGSHFWQDGGTSIGTATFTGTQGTAVNIGGPAGSGSWNGKIAEVIWYTSANIDVLNAAGGFLATKYALTWTDIEGANQYTAPSGYIKGSAGANVGISLPTTGLISYGAGDG